MVITINNQHILTGLVTWSEFYEEVMGRCNDDPTNLEIKTIMPTVRKYVKLFKSQISLENDNAKVKYDSDTLFSLAQDFINYYQKP
jgi:hypothetical protein